jgi:hypothetical protein
MQRIETYRHRAEVVDRAAAGASAESSGLLAQVAEQWRSLAEQVYRLSVGNTLGPLPEPRHDA